MTAAASSLLVLNGGSSSIRFAVYGDAPGAALRRSLHGHLDHLGQPEARLTYCPAEGTPATTSPVAVSGFLPAIGWLLDWLEAQPAFATVHLVAHRVVHGMEHTEPELITTELLAELHSLSAFDPEHLPGELALIEALRQRHPHLAQVACFDTAFHHTMPRVAQQLPLPRRLLAQGIRRYGFHGLSYAYLLDELARVAGPAAARGRLILAHLGGGASLAAVHEGRCLDTSMGFTPASGLPMGTRTGDLDPGAAWYVLHHKRLTCRQFSQLINCESGLLGISETTADMRELLARQATDERAAEAVAYFCYQARKWVGAYAAVLGGLDTLVFAGGIGEHAAEVRARICQGFDFLGLALDEALNAAHAPVISSPASRVTVRVIATDEAAQMARAVRQLTGVLAA